jgi:hypothetical protein
MAMVHWRPWPAWVAAPAPRLLAFANAVGRHPALAPVQARHQPAWNA